MSAAGGGKSGGPNTSGPGGQGRDYNGNAIGSRMPGEFTIGGPPRAIGGPAPIAGGRPAPGDLYNRPQPGFRVQPSPGVMPPGFGNPRQFNPGQGPMRPGMPTPMPMPGPGGGKGGGGIFGPGGPIDVGDIFTKGLMPMFKQGQGQQPGQPMPPGVSKGFGPAPLPPQQQPEYPQDQMGAQIGGTFGVDFGSPSDPGYNEARAEAGLPPEYNDSNPAPAPAPNQYTPQFGAGSTGRAPLSNQYTRTRTR
jgi:hypothetical protein